MLDKDLLRYWIALSQISGLGDIGFRKLLQAFGEPQQIYNTDYASLSKIVKEPIARAIGNGFADDTVQPALEWLVQPNNYLLTLGDAEYPQLLLQTADPPPLLYAKGDLNKLNQPCLAIVGSRNATPPGISNAEAFAETLSHSGLCIVSGMAAGIDAAAHRGGMRGAGGSVAVLGTGIDVVYPARHHKLAHDLAEHGALISEFPLGAPSVAASFPRRNRIISGLSLGCLVVEAALQSGSLITARLAAEQGREVFAIPGSIHSPLSKGCHKLIKQGVKLVEQAQDILEELGWDAAQRPPQQSNASAAVPHIHQDALLKALGFEPTSVDVIVERSALTTETVCALLLDLELAGRVTALPGGRYQRVN